MPPAVDTRSVPAAAGLDNAEAACRLADHGPNELSSPPRPRLLDRS